MSSRLLCTLPLSLALSTAAFADFHYTETTKISGGSMLGMMRLAGTFSKQARQIGDPVVSSVYVQGNRMARIGQDMSEIVDLDKETVTHVDHQKRQYYVITFQQMKEQFEEAQREAAQHQKERPPEPKPDANAPDMKFDIAVRNTGASREFSGLETKESILTLTLKATDKKSGESGNITMTNDLWMTPEIPGYQEVRDFNLRYAKKMGEVYGSILNPMMASMRSQLRPGATEGMGEMAKEISKLRGIPLYTVMRMGSTPDGKPLPAASEAPLPADNQDASLPSKGDLAKEGATSAAASAISSKLGGFGGMMGGFGRKKKEQPAPPPVNDTPNAQAASMVLMETTTEMGNFSSAHLDGAQFHAPAGYVQVPVPERPHRQ